MIDTYIRSHQQKEQHAKQFALTQKSIEKIKKISTKKIIYPEFEEAYEYVDDLFPDANVKDVIIHKVMAKDLQRMGFDGVEGFYDPVSKIVVVSGFHKSSHYGDARYKIEAKVEKDEVIVHELCHYSYVSMGFRSISSEMREEFAYGWSIGYLRKKGHDDEFIIKYNFLPYLYGVCNEKATIKILAQNGITISKYNSLSSYKRKECNKMYRRKIFLLTKELATERGQQIIDLYSDKLKEGGYVKSENKNKYGRYGMLDL
jgi:hypothetical protein